MRLQASAASLRSAEPFIGSACAGARSGAGSGAWALGWAALWHAAVVDLDTVAALAGERGQDLLAQAGRADDEAHARAAAGVALADDPLRARCEQAIRNYDPCISCATHAFRLQVDRSLSTYRL